MNSVSQPILSHVYDNGLVLVAEPSPETESAAFTFLLPGGCCYEDEAAAGLAGLTCEMSLRGAGGRDSRAFVQDLDRLGVERGESVGVSQVSFGGATIAENLPAALSIYSDVLRVAELPSDQLEAGKMVCLQEIRAIEDDPSHKLMIELRRAHYPHPWGRPSYGTEATLATIKIDHVRDYYQRFYRPNGAILGLAGNFDWEATRDWIGELLSDWPAAARNTPSETPGGERSTHIHMDSGQTQIGIAFPSLPYRHPDYFLAWGAVGVLSGGMSSRLFTEVREKRGLCYSVHASLNTQRDRAAVLCHAGTTAERAQETLNVTCGELVRLGEGVATEELQRLKARIKSSLIMQQESTSSRSAAIAREWYHLGKARSLDEIGSLIDNLNADSINAYLAENPPADFTIVTLGPQPLETPGAISA